MGLASANTIGLVSPSQSNNGDTIEASDINDPINQLAAVINGSIETANLADSAVTTAKIADGAVTPAKLLAGAGSSWTPQTQTPTITASSGTFTSATGATRWMQYGRIIILQITVTITTNGTAAGNVYVTLPANVNATGAVYSAYGRADGVSGKMLQGKFESSTNKLYIVNYDGTYPGANGEVLRMSGWYEIA